MLIYAAFTRSLLRFRVLLQGHGVNRSNPEDVAPACKTTVGRGIPNSQDELDCLKTRQQELGSPSSVPLSWPAHS